VRLNIPSCLLVLGAAQGNRSAHRTLRAWEVDVLSKANYWEQNKKQRMAEFEDLQVGAALVCAQGGARGRGVQQRRQSWGRSARAHPSAGALQSGFAGVEPGVVRKPMGSGWMHSTCEWAGVPVRCRSST
jgi:hypothetical protein